MANPRALQMFVDVLQTRPHFSLSRSKFALQSPLWQVLSCYWVQQLHARLWADLQVRAWAEQLELTADMRIETLYVYA